MEKVKRFFGSECFRRAIRTFVQTAAGYVVTNLTMHFGGIDYKDSTVFKSALIGFIISALAAGLAAVMNLGKCVNSKENQSENAQIDDDTTKEDEIKKSEN